VEKGNKFKRGTVVHTGSIRKIRQKALNVNGAQKKEVRGGLVSNDPNIVKREKQCGRPTGVRE